MTTQFNWERKRHIIPVFISHQGCPFRCIFCNQSKINGAEEKITVEKMVDIIERHLAHPKFLNDIPELAFFGGSFTCMSLDLQNELLEVALRYRKEGRISSVRLSTRPDCISIDILENLKKFGVDVVELGVQSLDDDVLLYSKRGYSSQRVVDAVSLLKRFQFRVGLQMMVGLPGDSYQKTQQTARGISDLSADFVRIYPALVIKNTELEKAYNSGEFRPMPLTEAVNTCADLLFFFDRMNIPVIRLGLQASENIKWGGDLVAGPFHPSFRQLVESERYRILFDRYFSELNVSMAGEKITIRCNAKKISDIIGQKKENAIFLSRRFGVADLNFVPTADDSFIINWNHIEYQPDIKKVAADYLRSKMWQLN